MELKLPLIVERSAGRHVRCWLPHWPAIRGEGVSLSELKDDLSLMVMTTFDVEATSQAWRWQMAPHLKLKHVAVDTVAKDREDGRAYKLQGRIAVLLEKWPDDAFWVATPTQAPELRFAIASPDDVKAGLERRLEEHCLARRIETLEEWHAEKEQRLDVLEVDADAPTVLPRGSAPQRKRRKPSAAKKNEPEVEAPETPEERELRRARARLSVRTLRQIGRNLSHQARDGDLGRAQGREGIVEALVDALERRTGVGVVLVGQGGVGKTAIIHEVTRRLVARQTAGGTRRDVWRIDGNQFIAGMSYVGQWEARARELCTELIDTADVLYVDDLATLVYAGRHSKGDTHVAMYLEPHLARGELAVIAECTPERFERVREEAPSFAALFDVVQVPAMSERETLPVLLSAVRELEAEDGGMMPRLSPDVMELALSLSGRFFAHRALPGRAVRLVHQVLAGAGQVEGRVRRYRAGDVFEAVKRETGLPDFVLGGATPKTRAQIFSELSTQVAGQPEAIEAVTDAVLALQLSVQDVEKPLANYLFVGPTGVGKTETARALARYLFGSSERMVRFDMSEFANPYSIMRLIGVPGGPDGELVTALRTQPFCVVLFDEIEKAHPRVFDALLQFLGEGRLTDATGLTADGRNCVVVMTSNLGVREAASQAGFGRGDPEGAAQHYLAAARAFFRPELFNRLDRVVPFRSLDKKALRVVVEHALGELLGRRGLQRGNVLVDVEPELLELLVDQAFDPRYGARPLKRALERNLAVPLAHHLLRRELDELALVELLRRGDEPQLSVRLLAPAPRVPVSRVEEWTLPRLRVAAREAFERVTGLLGSPAARRLRSLRRAALEEKREVPVAASILDGLEALSARLEELTEGTLEPAQYDEQVRGLGKNPSSMWRTARFGLRARPSVEGVVYAVNVDAVVSVGTPQLSLALDELTLLAHQLEASGRDETVTLLIEVVGPPAPEAVAKFSAWLPPLGHLLLGEDATGRWEEPTDASRRRAAVFHGPGVRAMVAPWFGYARVEVAGEHGLPRRALVRCVPLEGGDGSPQGARAALAAWDEQVKAEREARRRGGLPGADPWPRVVVDQRRFVATGLEVERPSEHLAACLRAGGR
ncbi:MAG: AAA family ATPase [Myxococcota bacterium]